MHIQTKTVQLSRPNYHRVFLLIYFWKIWKAEFAQWCLHFFFAVKQRLLFGKQKNIVYCLLRKNYIANNEHKLFYETFLLLWMGNWCKQCEEKKKIKHSMSLKSCCSRHLFFFTSIFFESYYKILIRPNKTIL